LKKVLFTLVKVAVTAFPDGGVRPTTPVVLSIDATIVPGLIPTPEIL
jgi:hypothetical protein